MFELLRAHQRKAATAVLVLIPLILIATRAGASIGVSSGPAPLGWMQQAVGYGQLGGYRVVGGVGSFWLRLTAADVVAENEELKAEVSRLREEKSRLIGVLQENARLRELVGLKRRHPEYELLPAQVIARDVTPYFRVITVRIKHNGEVQPRMPVVAAGGVVGQVHRVFGEFADVVVVSDPRSRIDAVSQRNRAQGLVQGLGHERDYYARVSYLSGKDEVSDGDVMVTSGMGGIFPRELVIGTVRKLDESERGLFQKAWIEPAVDFSRLEEVFVIVSER
jgi:rod shape-determining protein MreC